MFIQVLTDTCQHSFIHCTDVPLLASNTLYLCICVCHPFSLSLSSSSLSLPLSFSSSFSLSLCVLQFISLVSPSLAKFLSSPFSSLPLSLSFPPFFPTFLFSLPNYSLFPSNIITLLNHQLALHVLTTCAPHS